MDDSTDESLMTQVQQGRLDGMTPLFERYHAALLNFFFRQTGDREASRDLVQIVFERLLRYRSSYRTGAMFRPWMYQTARNALADHRRRHARQPVELLAPPARDGDEETPALAEPPDPSWRSRRVALELQEALGRLPDDDRELLVLSRFHGLQYDEIAQITRKSVSAVKVQAHRAIRALRRIYFEEEAPREA